ncbi:unnamed protein product [Phaedon cochleariae]|uniref:Uncharacterized protein n=1 Tax=Phaedon cochleariae TaxID=80249 RepID=A0A9P0DIA4_PHACE|nr:unnamed protein product [Phaedon cochleariae]
MWWTLLPILLLPLTSKARMDCSKAEYDRCVRIADPLVKEAHLVFPDNVNDIDQVCTTWNLFVDCLKAYTDDCFTDQQRRQFNRAVESPIESIHQMCMQPSYQKEYLQYAPCIKSTIIQRMHCGHQYDLLVELVDQGDIISKSTLCCSHDRFKQCVQRETRQLCDRGATNGPANKFATEIIDKALKFLQDQCLNYIPNSGDCAVHPTDPYADRSDPMGVSGSPTDLYAWSTLQDPPKPKEDRQLPPSVVPSTYPWGTSTSSSLSSSDYPTQLLGSRTRPASYGRASTWSDNNNNVQQVASNTVRMYPDVGTTTKSTWRDWNSVPSWSTTRGQQSTTGASVGVSRNTARVYSSPWNTPSTTTETWYPAAGNQLNNEVDEPNQLGLKKPKNSAERFSRNAILIFVTLLNILVRCY